MSSLKSEAIDRRRRRLSFGVATAFLLQACGGGGGDSGAASTPASGAGAANPPANGPGTLSLADFGGTPGASAETLRRAFSDAFAKLAAADGGTLTVPPGVYDFGDFGAETDIVVAEGARNVTVSAYGATFRVNTTANVIPTLFLFSNPENVTFAGASFNDIGFNPNVDWRGMYCVRVGASRASSGFRMVDCSANGAVGLFAFQTRGAAKYLMRDIGVQGTVTNAYYGANLTYAGDNANVDLVCQDVRRGCIAYGLRNAAIRIKMTQSAAAPGSNGFISLACEGASAGNVENVSIQLDASGNVRHRALVHFYHEQSEATGTMRNLDATVTVNSTKLDGMPADVFTFDHELPGATIAGSTARTWEDITLEGSVTGGLAGRIVDNPSVSTGPSAIYIDRSLAEQTDLSTLPGYFRIKTS